ncbi:MAG: hypothetical protein ACFCUM_19355 [Bacteroidales bacterium]
MQLLLIQDAFSYFDPNLFLSAGMKDHSEYHNPQIDSLLNAFIKDNKDGY